MSFPPTMSFIVLSLSSFVFFAASDNGTALKSAFLEGAELKTVNIYLNASEISFANPCGTYKDTSFLHFISSLTNVDDK